MTSMTINEDAAEALATTREYLETHPWTQGSLQDGDTGGVCLFGAMVYGHDLWDVDNDNLEGTVNTHPDLLAATWYLADLVGPEWREVYEQRFGEHHPSYAPVTELVTWNDEEGVRTKQEVLDTLAKAEKIARTGFDPDAA
jgi:hypothetical protein